MRRNRMYSSPVWRYFTVCEDNAVLAQCLLCGVQVTRGGNVPNRCGTTNLRRHVRTAHDITLPSKRGDSEDGSKKTTKRPNSTRKNAIKKLQKIPISEKDTKSKVGLMKEKKETLAPPSEPIMCIRWNTYLSNMTATLPSLMNDEQFVDVTLACEGQSLKCHKVLLAACSPYLHHLLSSANCPHPVIMFKDYHFWELQALVAFMYSGEVNVPQSQLPRILRVAESLQIKGLAKPVSKDEPDDKETNESNETSEPPFKFEEVTEKKRKRKPSSYNCCKIPIKTSKSKAKTDLVKPKGKQNLPKKKTSKQRSNKIRRMPPAKKSCEVKTFAKLKGGPTSQEDIILPELEDFLGVDMLNSTDIDGEIDLATGNMDIIFPIPDLKEDMRPDAPDIGSLLETGLYHKQEPLQQDVASEP